MGWLSDIFNPTPAVIHAVTGGSGGQWLDGQGAAMQAIYDNRGGIGRWLQKEAKMPGNEANWWKNTVNGNNGNNLGALMASHNDLHADSTRELNKNNWFANNPDKTAAMVFSMGSASGAFGAGSAFGEGAGVGADAVGEEAALAGGSSIGAGAGTVEGVGSAAASGSEGLGSLSTADSAAGDSALASGETSANLGSSGGVSNLGEASSAGGSAASTSGNLGSSLKDYWNTGNRLYKGYNAIQDAKHDNWLGAAQNAWGAYGNGAGFGSSSTNMDGGGDAGGYSSDGGSSDYGNSGGNGVDDNWWDNLISNNGSSNDGLTSGWGDSYGGAGSGAPDFSGNSVGAYDGAGIDAVNGTGNGNSWGSSDTESPNGSSYPQQLRNLFQQGNQYLQPIGGLRGGLRAASTLYGMYNQRRQANLAHDYMNQMGGMYQPGTPEYQQFARQLAAHDAAHGRRSQEGSRSVQLAAAMADNRSRVLSSPAYQSALGAYGARNSSTLNGLFSLAGQYNPS